MPADAVAPEGLAAGPAAKLVGVSRSQFYKLHAAGRVPLPVYLSPSCPRWLRADLLAWLAAGCPDRQTWAKRTGRKGVRR